MSFTIFTLESICPPGTKQMALSGITDMQYGISKTETVGTDFMNNYDGYIVLLTWPEVEVPTSAKACMIAINRPKHTASQYILKSSFSGSMVIKIEGNTRMNTGITIPDDQNELTNFTMAVVNNECIRWK